MITLSVAEQLTARTNITVWFHTVYETLL